MPHIQQLSPHVADLIAAGEVVERPASVVKELLENAIDAGAQSVTVEMKNGGMTYLRVSDDGCGIAPSELPTAFLRHATSKLRTAEDLAAIGTLGFRGEALAAISSVSRLDIFSRERGALSGAKLHLEGGVPGAVEDAGCPEGTSIIVRDLFYNTPARLKFMKRDSAEATAIAGLVGHLALSHPEVSFKLIKDGTQTLLTPGDGALRSAIYASLGREFTLSLLEVKGTDGDMGVTGFVTSPIASRGTRGMQTFFVNGRLVKSQLLTAALEEAYSNRMMKGKFPGCVLHLDIRRSAVDVNVHPAKKTSMIIETADPAPFQSAEVYLAKFAFATDVTFTEKYEGSTDGMVQVSTHTARGFIPMMELIDRDKELARLNKEKAKAEKEMAMFANQLDNPKFVERAPAALVEDIRNKYAKSQDKLANIEQSIKALG